MNMERDDRFTAPVAGDGPVGSIGDQDEANEVVISLETWKSWLASELVACPGS
jgi:hypothetical protein